MMIGMVLFWGVILLCVVWLVRGAARGWSTASERVVTTETPVEILERRFAEGAISVDDYRVRREVLLNGNAEPSGGHNDEPLAASHTAEGSR